MQTATSIPSTQQNNRSETGLNSDWQNTEADGWRELAAPEPMQVTLLDLVTAVSEVADNEEEIVGTVAYMLASGSVALNGTFRDEALGALLGSA